MGNFFEELRRRNVVRVAGVYAVVGWVLIQIATTLEESMGLPAWFDGLIVALLLIGLPIAVIFAWAFELTPDGVVRTEDVPEDKSITRETGRKLDYSIVAGIVALAIIMLWQGSDKRSDEPEAAIAVQPAATESVLDVIDAPLEKSIAVLPFENRSPNPDDAFFADGVHDDLLTHLSKIRDMHVISRTSVMGYADTERRIPDIGRELGVATVMEGAVQRAGNRVRINVQLIDAETDAHLWAEIYDRELTADNIFDIQSEITKAIAGALNSVLSSEDEYELDKRPTEVLAAYDAYMTGQLLTSVYFGGNERFEQAIDAFNLAIELDPDFAAAYAGKAYANIGAYWYSASDEIWRDKALESIIIAEEMAPDSVETLTVLGYIHYWGYLDYAKADDAFRRARAIAPNYILALAGHAFSMRREGRFAESIATMEKALRLDPLNHDVALSLAETYAHFGRFNEARATLERARQIESSFGFDPTQIGWILSTIGDAEGAWSVANEPTPTEIPNADFYRAYHALQTRDPQKIRQALESWPEDQRELSDPVDPYLFAKASALIFLGETDAAQEPLAALQARVEASENPYPQGWRANAIILPVELPGLMGDLEGVRAAVSEYEATVIPDAFGLIDVQYAIARSFARAGDPDAAFDYIYRIRDGLGPWIFARLSIEPDLDSLQDDPRWSELETEYDAWAAVNL